MFYNEVAVDFKETDLKYQPRRKNSLDDAVFNRNKGNAISKYLNVTLSKQLLKRSNSDLKAKSSTYNNELNQYFELDEDKLDSKTILELEAYGSRLVIMYFTIVMIMIFMLVFLFIYIHFGSYLVQTLVEDSGKTLNLIYRN